ncbi:RhuM family protein [Alkaliphilus crotonatoxidans]
MVQKEGTREINRDVLFSNLDAIISVGYRVNSLRATQFRQWATACCEICNPGVESQAERNIPMRMEDWAKELNEFLQFNKKDILENAGKVTATIAKEFAESEFEKYRIIQDRIFQSDFDRLTNSIKNDESNK